jgi:hypothetical protein
MGNPIREVHFDGCLEFLQLEFHPFGTFSSYEVVRSPYVITPLWASVGVKPNTSKVRDLESSGTPECLEFDSKAQNISH